LQSLTQWGAKRKQIKDTNASLSALNFALSESFLISALPSVIDKTEKSNKSLGGLKKDDKLEKLKLTVNYRSSTAPFMQTQRN